METFNTYPVRRIEIEFKDGEIYANGRKHKDIDELLEWIRDCYKVNVNPLKTDVNN